MKAIAMVFGVLAIYTAAFGVTSVVIGPGDLGRVAGGLLGTVVLVAIAGAMRKKDD